MPIDVIRSKIVIAGLSYIQPVFQADYLQIKVIAEVTMPDVLNVDIVTPTDLVSLSTTKALSDSTTGFTDSQTVAALKAISDSITMVDSADISYVIGKALADLQPIVEDLAVASTKLLPNEDLYLVDNMDGNIEFQFVKVVNELQFIAEAANLETGKVLSEVASIEDALSILLIIQRSFSESLAATDDNISAKEVAKALFDAALPLDAASFDHSKPFSDAADALDTSYKDFSKVVLGIAQDYCDPTYFLEQYVLNEVTGDWLYTTNDVFTKQIIYGRNVADLLTSADELQPFDISKGLSEVVNSTEVAKITSAKPLQDGFSLSDNMDGNLEYQIVKVINELQFITEAPIIALFTEKADNIATSDAGLVVIQDYASPSYFLEDYVGNARTF